MNVSLHLTFAQVKYYYTTKFLIWGVFIKCPFDCLFHTFVMCACVTLPCRLRSHVLSLTYVKSWTLLLLSSISTSIFTPCHQAIWACSEQWQARLPLQLDELGDKLICNQQKSSYTARQCPLEGIGSIGAMNKCGFWVNPRVRSPRLSALTAALLHNMPACVCQIWMCEDSLS